MRLLRKALLVLVLLDVFIVTDVRTGKEEKCDKPLEECIKMVMDREAGKGV